MVKQPTYEVVKKLENVEIRRYPSLVLARVEGNEGGFDILFRYITGNNRQRKKVAMTAPVISEKIEMTAPVLEDAGSMAFIMPETYRLDTVPEPLDGRVRIVEVPARLLGVLRFSGRWSYSIFEEKTRELYKELARAGIETKGEVISMLYNPPFTPWFLRRNEVAIEVSL